MLDQFIWGSVARISPEAPVPGRRFSARELHARRRRQRRPQPHRAASAAPNCSASVGRDVAGAQLKSLLREQQIGCTRPRAAHANRPTSLKTRIVAHKQQVVRIDRETRDGLDTRRLNTPARHPRNRD